jgi:DNA N-6-adenine-methyltransferase (Dam)
MSKVGFTHESHENLSVDWYTPPWIFEEMGLSFDLDPCSPKGGVHWIPKKKYYTIEDDGLTQPWDGLVWCNPPYGKYTAAWLKRMNQHRNGMSLVFARTDCAWFHDSVAHSDAILFLRGRVKFVDGLGKTGGSGAGSGSMLIAWGDECKNTLIKMKKFGLLWLNDGIENIEGKFE